MAKAKVNQTRPELVRAKAAAGTVSRYKYPSAALPHSMILTFKKYDYKDVHKTAEKAAANKTKGIVAPTGTSVKESTTIVLPLPTNLVDNTALRINGFEKSIIMDAAQQVLSSGIGNLVQLGEDLAKGVQNNTVTELASKIAGKLSMSTEQAKSMATYGLQSILGKSQTLSAQAGGILNPKETLGFEGVNLRSHSFKWDLIPADIGESEQIKNIVRIIKQKALPQTGNIGDLFSKVIMGYPHVVDIDLVGLDTSHFMDFKTCMITNVSVQYGTGDDVPIIKGGKPAVITLSIELTELEAQTADDYGAATLSLEGGTKDSGAN